MEERIFEFFILRRYLEAIIGKQVDLVTENALKTVEGQDLKGGHPCRLVTGNFGDRGR